MLKRKALIIGAALAVLHQIEIGDINTHRAAGYYDPDAVRWDDIKQLQVAVRLGVSPDHEILMRLSSIYVDCFAHLRQTMRVSYEEWYKVFPWLETYDRQ